MTSAEPRSPLSRRTRLAKAVRRLFASRLLRNTLIFFGLRVSQLTVPLVVIAFLSRLIPADDFGRVMLSQSLAAFASVLITFGFSLYGAREIANCSKSKESLSQAIYSILGAQLLLAIGVIAIGPILALWIPPFEGHYNFIIPTFIYTVGLGIIPIYYYQGIEKPAIFGIIELIGSFVVICFIFLLMLYNPDGLLTMWIIAIGRVGMVVVAIYLIFRENPFYLPYWREICQVLVQSWPLFIGVSGHHIYRNSNVIVLSWFVSAAALGPFAAAERVVWAVTTLMRPIFQAVYPRLCALAHEDDAGFRRLLGPTFAVSAGLGLLAGLTLVPFAPLVSDVLLGDPGGVHYLWILGALLPITQVSTAAALYIILPSGHDHLYTRLAISTGVVNVALGAMGAAIGGGIGMAIAIVASQTYLMMASLLMSWRILKRN